MSVPSSWDPSAAVQNSAFAGPDQPGMHSFDPSGGMLAHAAGIDGNHFQQQHQQQRAQLQNGNSRTSSPGYQTPAYNVNPVVPLKRPRPRGDSISISPRPQPQGLPSSRSQTPLSGNPQLAYQIYQNNVNAGQQQPPQQQPPPRQFTPVGYQTSHLQQVGSVNASPSPVMQSQGFQGNPPKRVATQSPSPFSPAPSQQGFMPQGSPPPNRVGTPQGNNLAVPPQQGYPPQGYSQGYSSPGTTASVSPVPAVHQQNMQAQMMYAQMHRQQQQHQQQQRYIQQQQQSMMAQSMPPNTMPMHAQMNPSAMNPNQMARPQQVPQARPNDPNSLMKSIQEYMARRGTPIQQNPPYIGSKPVNLVQLYTTVLKLGGANRVSQENRWQHIAMTLQFAPEQYPSAPQELMMIYRQNLLPYEQAWLRDKQQKAIYHQQQQNQQQQQQQQQVARQHSQQPSQSPQMQQSSLPPTQQTPRQQMGPVKQSPGMTPNYQQQAQPMSNGYTPHRQSVAPLQTPTAPNRASMDGTPQPSPAFSIPGKSGPAMDHAYSLAAPSSPMTPLKEPPADFAPKVRTLDTHGGLTVPIMAQLGAELMYHKPIIPSYLELGVVDIHALTMMLKSGLPAEVRLALDTLATISVETRTSIALESCEDLVESLIDVAEAAVELLGDHARETTDSMSLPAYEDVLRACRAERESLLIVPQFRTLEHDLERAADRLICITTIFRNLSFFEANHNALADPNVVRFLSSVIERLGTSTLFLRTHTNLLDFMKDIVIYLSNLSHAIVLPSEDEALNLLHLLLAFAPQPGPWSPDRESLMFTPYSPLVHRYLPPAVDTLAKLLARDEPNRAFYKTIFLSESTTTPPYDLLTRAFALSISPIPDNARAVLQQAVEARKPFLEQGMLAADILAGMVPSPETGVARSWLSSEDGFALSLLRLVCLLSPQANTALLQPPRQQGKMVDHDPYPFARITHRGMSVLRKLASKAEDPSDEGTKLPIGMLPKKESLLGALLTVHIDGTIVKELCTYAGLDD